MAFFPPIFGSETAKPKVTAQTNYGIMFPTFPPKGTVAGLDPIAFPATSKVFSTINKPKSFSMSVINDFFDPFIGAVKSGAETYVGYKQAQASIKKTLAEAKNAGKEYSTPASSMIPSGGSISVPATAAPDSGMLGGYLPIILITGGVILLITLARK